MKNYDEASVIRTLNKKNGCKVDSINKIITVDRTADDLGNGSWGKIDYLVRVHKYIYVFTSSKIVKRPIVNTEEKEKVTKTAKRENKINMAAMSKNAMKKAKK